MTIETLTSFFLWCSIINGGVLIFSSVVCIGALDLIYGIHSRWFKIPRENYDAAIFLYLGMFKVAVLVFNIVPYVALRVIA